MGLSIYFITYIYLSTNTGTYLMICWELFIYLL